MQMKKEVEDERTTTQQHPTLKMKTMKIFIPGNFYYKYKEYYRLHIVNLSPALQL